MLWKLGEVCLGHRFCIGIITDIKQAVYSYSEIGVPSNLYYSCERSHRLVDRPIMRPYFLCLGTAPLMSNYSMATKWLRNVSAALVSLPLV